MTLRQILDERGLRHSWVASQVGVSPSTLSRIMRGQRRMSPAVVERLADVLGVPVAQLLEGVQS